MGVYIGLLLFIMLVAIFIYSSDLDEGKKKIYFLRIVFTAIFLLYSLRASTVGRDIPGYEKEYIFAGTRAWNDYSYVYFENGYIFLMKVCNLFGLSFQMFLTIVNCIILVPIYLFLKKYSNHPCLSVMTYVCYIFFEFNLTGLRQAIASSIFLLAIITYIGEKRFYIVKYIVIVYIATLFHKGAFIGFLYLPFHFIRKPKYYLPAIFVMLLGFFIGRGSIMSFTKEIFEKHTMNSSSGLYIGSNFIFLILLAALFIIAMINNEKNLNSIFIKVKSNHDFNEYKMDFYSKKYSLEISNVFNKLFLLSICVLILFGSDTAVRSYMFLNQVILVHLPNSIDCLFTHQLKKIFAMGFMFFLVAFFFYNTLLFGGFDIVPYKFFWQV